MTYGELKTRVLNLIFSYSIAGDPIELSYDNQEDYVNMIPGLLSSAQSYIYQIKKIRDSIMLRDLTREDLDTAYLYILPDDCINITPGIIIPRGISCLLLRTIRIMPFLSTRNAQSRFLRMSQISTS